MVEEDIRLVKLALKGQRLAFKRLVEKYQNFVFTITFKVLRSREEAEEAAQDVFIKVYKTLSSFEQKSKFSTWLYTIAYRTAIDKSRKKQLNTYSIDNDDSFIQIEDTGRDNPDKQLFRGDLHDQLHQAIQHLKSTDATLITLFYLHEKSVKEIAEITGLSISNIKTKLHRVREALKKVLSKQLKAELQDLL